MGETSRVTRLLLAAFVVAASAAAVGAGQAGAQPRIVGGERASIGDHSYAVYLTTLDGFQYCGGTLVDATKVVTAAHCTVDKTASEVLVVGGREDKESDAGITSKVVGKIWVHPDYDDVRSGADVSVLTLEKRLPYDTAALAGPDDADLYEPGTVGLILGWGRTASDGDSSQFLLKAEVPVVSDEDCLTSYETYASSSMVCAGLPEGGVDTCQGDSGGPLVVDGVLVGITSWGEGCAEPNKYGVYTRVATYFDDVRRQI
jgi:trypsin